jgi:hypothetical protein
MKRSFSISAVALGIILVVAASCSTPRTVSSYPYPGSPYPGSYPGGTTYPYPGSPYPGSYPYPESYPAGRYPTHQQRPVVVYRQPEKVYVPDRRKEVIVEHRNDRNDRKYNERNDNRRDRDGDHDHDNNRGNHRSYRQN